MIGETSLGNQVAEEPNVFNWPTLVMAKGWHATGDGDACADGEVVQRRPSIHGEERMVTGDFDAASCPRAHTIDGLYTAVDPVRDGGSTHNAVLGDAKYPRLPA